MSLTTTEEKIFSLNKVLELKLEKSYKKSATREKHDKLKSCKEMIATRDKQVG